MSVLIRDMEMPETCDDCQFHRYHSHNEYVCVATPLFYPMNLANSKSIRKDWCPLVALPEKHGDLIDRDEFFSGLSSEDFQFSFHVDGAFVDVTKINKILQSQKVVIEAEGEE